MTSSRIRFSLSLLGLLPLLGCADQTAETPNHPVQLLELADRIRIEVHGQLFSEYVFRGASKPYLHPILAADGTAFTRDWPMIDGKDFTRDHPHHRSLWYGHGLVNGHDFWRERQGTGRIVHESVTTFLNGNQGTIHAINRWELPDGTVICTDERTIRVHSASDVPLLDFEITLHASHGPLNLGDTEEGSMAIRLHEQMPVTLKRGELSTPGPGRIVNSNGDENIAAWGKRAEWCEYTGTVDGRRVGVAIFDHPTNPRHPTWWHVRPYGLFAANPFGQHDFEKLADEHSGDLAVPAGGSVTFRYRFYFHFGDEETARVADHYQAYAQAAPAPKE
jgi:hypothetical protein